MRLKSITLIGFKSFVDRTRVDLPNQITAIVGPNGCGKSNTIDAVRWVMGESSAKYLRGESMADVIFNGSLHRAPLGQASIELHFDNTLGRLGGEYASYNEIIIRRQVTRDGQSNYYLNGTRCRRKDITNIFLGTGLGPRSYAIIEQGTISRLIEAKPEELRIFLEEAAGISRYKEKRKETQQRIEHTRENLLRINDVREELGKQVVHLERQAKTAEKYKEYKVEERLLRAQLFAFRYQQLQHEYAQHQIQLNQLHAEIATHEAHHADLSEQLSNQFDQQHQTQKNVVQNQEQHAEINTALRVCEQNILHNRTQQQQFDNELKQITRQQTEAHHLNMLDDNALEQLMLSLQSVQAALIESKQQLEQRQQQHLQATNKQRNWQSQWQDVSLQLAKSSQTAQVEQTRMQQIEQRLQQLKNQQKKSTEEKAVLTTQEDEAQYHELQKKTAELNALHADHHAQLSKHSNALSSHREQQQLKIKELHDMHRELQQLEGKLTALNTLQNQALGNQEQNIKIWLTKHQLDQSLRLANHIEVESDFEAHLEGYLCEKLQAIILDDFNRLDELLADFPKGHLSLIQSSAQHHHPEQAEASVSLASKVKGPKALLQQLEQVYCAQNLLEALTLISSLPEHAEVITANGLLVQHQWVEVRRGKDEQNGILQRKREIKQLQQMTEQIKKNLVILEQKQAQLEEKIIEVEQQKQAAQRQYQEIEKQQHQLNAESQIQQSKIQQKRDRMQQLSKELEVTFTEHQQLEQQYSHSHEIWQNALTHLNELKNTKDQLAEEQNNLEVELSQANRCLNEAQELIQQQQIKQQKFSTEHQSLSSQKQRMTQQLQQLMQRQTALVKNLEQLKPLLEELETESATLKEKIVLAETTLEQTKNLMIDGEKKLRDIEARRQTLAQSLELLRQNHSKHQIQAEHAQTKSSGILEQFSELDLVLTEVSNNLPDTFSEEASQTLLEQTQSRITRLGAINLAAINELDEQNERKQFIDAQYDDLAEALNTLESAIQEIDQETKEKFQETFNTVNNNFQYLFPKIFGGGQAYLSLTSDDLLDTGVIVFAQPPGKRNSSIHLLSGGEKALTALALVFGIFELNPSPFCMLDEVDAPLDDANVGRFCNLVQAMAEKTQFIVVTHNKVAMEMAHHLMGVTMQEPGVSRLVAVDVEAAIALASAHELAQ